MVAKLAKLRGQGRGADEATHFYSSSGGNAGLACVHAAIELGKQATVVVPLSTSDFIKAKLREAGAAEVLQIGASWKEADEYLTGTLIPDAQRKGQIAIYVPPFDAPEIWDGNATIAREIFDQIPSHVDIDAIVCSVGGGGLFCGLMQGLDELQKRPTQMITVETQGADSLAQAVAQKRLVTLPAIQSLATSLGARTVCYQALQYGLRGWVSNVVLSDNEAIEACRRFADDERSLVELACAVCPALCYNGRLANLVLGFCPDTVVVLVICGGSNICLEALERYVAGVGTGTAELAR